MATDSPQYDPAKSDHISRVRNAATAWLEATRNLIELGEIREDRGYNPGGLRSITQDDFVGDNATVALADFFAALELLGAMSVNFTPELRRALNRVRR